MTSASILSPDSIDLLFPFGFSIDSNGRLLTVGSKLSLLLPEALPGAVWTSMLKLERPVVRSAELQLADLDNQLIILQEVNGRFRLRGQLLADGTDRFCFLVSPWIEALSQLENLGLQLNDFALHDATPDVLYAMELQRTMVDDLKVLNDRLLAQRGQLSVANQKLERLSLLASRILSPVIIANASDEIEWVNEAFTQLTGYTLDEVVGRQPSQFLIGPETDRSTLDFINECCIAGRPFSCEIVNYTKERNPYWASLEVHPILDGDRRASGYICLQIDITRRKQAARLDALEITVSRRLAPDPEIEPALNELLPIIAAQLHLAGVYCWRASGSNAELACREHYVDASRFPQELQVDAALRFDKIGYDLSQRILQDPTLQSSSLHCGNLLSVIGLPLLVGETLYGMLEIYLDSHSEAGLLQTDFLTRLARSLAQFLSRKQAQWRQAELLSTLRATLEATADGLIIIDSHQRIVGHNQRLIDLWRFSPHFLDLASTDQVCAHILDQLQSPQSFIEQVERVERNAASVAEFTIALLDGRVFDVLNHPQRIKDTIIGRIWSFRDVTERWRSNQALRESEERYRMVSDSASDGILTLDVQQRIIYANDAAARILGHQKDQLIGHTVVEFIPSGIVHSPSSLQSFELNGVHASGQSLTLDVSLGESLVAGEPQRTVIFRDVTQRKLFETQLTEAKQQAESANKAKSDFLANMSHELRTPLNAILGYGEILIEDANDNGHSQYIRDLERILSAGKHLLNVINDILDISKIEAGKMVLRPEWVFLPDLLNDCYSLALPLAARNNNELRFADFAQLGNFWTDPTRLRQSLFNLLSNACKFTQNGLVELRFDWNTNGVRRELLLSVRDTGPGIAPADQARLFSPFTQLNSSATRAAGGTGLGLAITRQLASALGGTVSLDSTPGNGSTFTLALPVLSPEDLPGHND